MPSQLDWQESIDLDRSSRESLSDQLAAALQRRISSGALSEGARLPATRDLAAALKINRGTVQAAYRHLQEAGLARGRVGSGTIVQAPPLSPAPFDADALLSARVLSLSPEDSPAAGAPLIADFSRLTPDERFFPLEEFTRTLSEAWSRRSDIWQYAPPLGFEDLRREISARLSQQGLHRGPDEILVTSGAQQGLDLIFRTFTDPGDSVVMESPTYSGALALARFAGVRIVELPMGPDGPDVRPLLTTKAKLVYVMPERQNPTGVTAGEARREALVEALAARLPDRTIWLGTLSKDLVPGFRIGWIAGPAAIIERLARVKKTADFQTPLPLQAAVAAFLREGGDRRARRARAFDVEAKRITAARVLKAHLPEVLWWGGEIGSALFWLHLPAETSGRRVAQAAAARGVGVAPGADFDPRGEDRANVRLSVSRVDKREVEQGIRLFADAVRAVIGASGVHSMPVV